MSYYTTTIYARALLPSVHRQFLRKISRLTIPYVSAGRLRNKLR